MGKVVEMASGRSRPLTETDRARSLHRTVRRLDRLLKAAQQGSNRYTRWRLGIFLTGAVLTISLFQQGWYHLGNLTLGAFLLLFTVVARYHSRLEHRAQRLRLWRRIKTTHAARLRRDWTEVPSPDCPAVDRHPYAADLDLIGPHSLFHLLNTARSSNGRERLSAWLLNQPPTPAEWSSRRALIQELTDLPLFRDRLTLEAALVSESELDGRRVHTALDAPATFTGLRPILVLEGTLALATPLLLLGSELGGLPGYWSMTLAVYASIYLLTSSYTGPAFMRALSLHDELNKLGALFRVLEGRAYHPTPTLGQLCAPLIQGRTKPSLAIRRLARITHALSIRAHPLVHIGVNLLMPWDLFFTDRFERNRQQILSQLHGWLEALGELEASASLATFAYLHPTYAWPSVAEGHPTPDTSQATVSATGLGHPLLPAAQRVTNDLELRDLGRIVLITGSNMSGKSTFLRTLGINTCLAQAGAPVCATSFEWSWVRLACCIRVDDSLEAGLSFFYAEVKRLKWLLDAAQEKALPPLLFLIDEIFKGTNNRERLIGSRAYIRALGDSNGFGLVTTHDLELADLEGPIARLTNAHFQETVHGNQLRFDYKLRPGPCPTTNALRIMALEGLPVPSPGPSS